MTDPGTVIAEIASEVVARLRNAAADLGTGADQVPRLRQRGGAAGREVY